MVLKLISRGKYLILSLLKVCIGTELSWPNVSLIFNFVTPLRLVGRVYTPYIIFLPLSCLFHYINIFGVVEVPRRRANEIRKFHLILYNFTILNLVLAKIWVAWLFEAPLNFFYKHREFLSLWNIVIMYTTFRCCLN